MSTPENKNKTEILDREEMQLYRDLAGKPACPEFYAMITKNKKINAIKDIFKYLIINAAAILLALRLMISV